MVNYIVKRSSRPHRGPVGPDCGISESVKKNMSAPDVGEAAPDFTRTAHNGETVTLSAYRGRRIVVLYFYPKDGTSVCTKEACTFRDAFTRFTAAGAIVIGVSRDALERHQRFAEEQQLPFLLLSDADGSLAKAYGVRGPLGLLPGRETFVIDHEGRIRLRYRALMQSDEHIQTALQTVQQLVSSTNS